MGSLLEKINNALTTNLGNVCHYVVDKVDASELSVDNYISTENMVPDRGGIVRSSNLPAIGRVTRFESGDVLTSNIRPYFKKIWRATKSGGCSNDVLVFRSNNENDFNQQFLYYVLSDDTFFAHSMMTSQGTKMPRGDKVGIMKYMVPVLDTSVQKKIVEILSAYDAKIENNNSIIKNLETTAQTIFNEWFVKLRFPGYEKSKFIDSEMGEIPEGWKIKSVLDIIERISPGKKYENKTALPVGKIPILDQGASGFIGYHNDEPGVIASIENPVIVFTNHTCYYRILTEPFSCIQNVLPYIGKNGYHTLFVYFLTKEKIKMSEYKGHWPEFERQVFVTPPISIASQFADKAKILVTKMVGCEKENILLKKTRDQLLAKLI